MKEENGFNIKPFMYAIVVLLFCILIFNILTFAKIGNSTFSASGENEKEPSEDVEYDVSKFTAINETKFMELANSKDKQITYFGREGCGFCIQFIPVMNEAIEKLGIKMNYVDISENVDSSTEAYTKMTTMINDYYTKNMPDDKITYGMTPMIIVTQKGKIIEQFIGASEYATFKNWLENDVKI